MVIDYCTLNIQPCMVHFYVRSNTLIKMKYHSFLHVNFTSNYDHFYNSILDQIYIHFVSAFYAHSQSYHKRMSTEVALSKATIRSSYKEVAGSLAEHFLSSLVFGSSTFLLSQIFCNSLIRRPDRSFIPKLTVVSYA